MGARVVLGSQGIDPTRDLRWRQDQHHAQPVVALPVFPARHIFCAGDHGRVPLHSAAVSIDAECAATRKTYRCRRRAAGLPVVNDGRHVPSLQFPARHLSR